MRILRVEVEGYRSLGRVSWEPGALNVIIGPNGAGKTNLQRALHHLSRAARLGQDFSDALTQAGGVLQVLWNGEAERVRWMMRGVPEDGGEIAYELVIQPAERSRQWQIAHERLTRVGSGGPVEVFNRTRTTPLPQLRTEKPKREGQRDSKPPGSRATPLPKRAPDPVQPWLAWLPMWLGDEMRDRYLGVTESVRSWHFLPPFSAGAADPSRQRPSSGSGGAGATDGDRGPPDENQELAALLLRLYGGDIEFRREFDRSMLAAFADYQGLCIDYLSDGRPSLGVKWRGLRPMELGELSDGTRRFMTILSLLRTKPSHELIWLDQPETGLHPSMFPLVAESAHAASQLCQVAIATHSVELLHCLGAFRPAITVAQLIDGMTDLSRIELDAMDQWIAEYSTGKAHWANSQGVDLPFPAAGDPAMLPGSTEAHSEVPIG